MFMIQANYMLVFGRFALLYKCLEVKPDALYEYLKVEDFNNKLLNPLYTIGAQRVFWLIWDTYRSKKVYIR